MTCNSMSRAIVLLAVAACVSALGPVAARADVATLPAAHDNTIFQDLTSNSDGAGTTLFAGKISTGSIRRAFIIFDIAASAIPHGSAVDTVILHLNITRVPPSPSPTALSLFRVSSSWGEGTSSATAGTGAPAQPGDVTWLDRFFPNDPWTNPGGDIEPTLLSAGPVSTASGAYTIPSTPALVQDVQLWLDIPSAEDFGWMIQGDESAGAASTVREIGSRENATAFPTLEIHYTTPTSGVGPIAADVMQMSVSPQPFRSEARFSFTLPQESAVRLAVYDVRGRQVATLADGASFAAGAHALQWDGLTSAGAPAPAGLYFARLTTPADGSRTVRVLRVR